jgi:hypothetical protein
MTTIEIRRDRAPYPAMLRALELIEQSGFPRHENVAEAAVVLSAAIRQLSFASAEVQEICGVPE